MMSEHIDHDDLAGMTPAEVVDMVNAVLDSETALRNERDEAQRFAALWKQAATKARSDWKDAMGYWHACAEAYGAEKAKADALAERVRELEAAMDMKRLQYAVLHHVDGESHIWLCALCEAEIYCTCDKEMCGSKTRGVDRIKHAPGCLIALLTLAASRQPEAGAAVEA